MSGFALENPRVGGSIPPQATKNLSRRDNDLDNKATLAVAFCFVALSLHVAKRAGFCTVWPKGLGLAIDAQAALPHAQAEENVLRH